MTQSDPMRAPFPWAGGKRPVAKAVWRAFGDPPNYIEPFYATGAVLLGRPGGAGKIETANDLDGGVINMWRAMTHDPDAVARHCDWPVSELDLHAVHPWLIDRLGEMSERLRADRKYYDAEVAGWWLWGIAQWIGSGWCAEPNNHKRPRLDGIGKGVNGATLSRQLPKITVTDGASGTGGVHRIPSLGNDRGVHGVAAPPCEWWFRQLQQRLRRVRWVCGDWRRVLTPSVLGKGKNVGGRKPCAVFFDPPYDEELRSRRCYREDSPGVARAVRQWCLEHGDDPELRIALCGYLEEHDEFMPQNWTRYRWTGSKGYAGADNTNREQETIWLSPHCLPVERQRGLFEECAAQ